MNFQEQLQNQLAQQTKGDRERAEYPSDKLKHKELFFPKANPSTVIIRILPPVTPGDNYNVPTREIFLQTRNRNGKDIKLNAVLSAVPNAEDDLDQAIVEWQAQARIPSNYKDSRPTSKYLVNCVQLLFNPNTQQYDYERDAEGNLAVRLFKLSHTACQLINTSLSQPQFRPADLATAPADVAQYSFISALSAFPVSITKPPKGSGIMTHNVQVMSNMPLGALPQGWENSLEDLHYQATPSIEYNAEYVKYFIDVVNGVEPVGNGAPHPATQGYEAPGFVPQQQQGLQTGYAQPMQGGYPQQPVQQPQATNMGTPSFGQTNMGTPPTMNGGFQQQAPQQPVAQQPMQNFQQPAQAQPMQQQAQAPQQQATMAPAPAVSAPMGTQAPMPDASAMSNVDMVAPTVQQSVTPDVVPNQQPVQQQPVQQTQTQQPATQQPQVTTDSNGLPNINDLLGQM